MVRTSLPDRVSSRQRLPGQRSERHPSRRRRSSPFNAPMEPKLRQIAPFIVSGISIRTSNSAESDSSTAELANLWDRFFGENVAANIPHQSPDSPIYGVYSEYESDVDGLYTTTAGVRVAASNDKADRNGVTEVVI